MSKVVNGGKNAIRDALLTGKDIQIELAEVGTDGNATSVTDTQLGNKLEDYATTNVDASTGEARFEFTIPETDAAVDGQTLREVGLKIDPAGEDTLFCRIRFADTPKAEGDAFDFEITATTENA